MIYTITHSKVRFEYLCPKVSDILFEDIAHSLSNLCRFTGHVRTFESVAQHSIMVSQYVSKENALWGLLHDAPETYVNDLSSPLKKLINGNYLFFHDMFMTRICDKFGLPREEPSDVKKWDRIITVNELWCLIDDTYEEENIPELFDHIECWQPEKAKEEFYKRFEELK